LSRKVAQLSRRRRSKRRRRIRVLIKKGDIYNCRRRSLENLIAMQYQYLHVII